MAVFGVYTAQMVTKWQLQNQITDALMFVLNNGLSLVYTEKGWGLRITATDGGAQVAVQKKEVNRMIKEIYDKHWISMMHSLKNPVPTQYIHPGTAPYIKAWLSDKQTPDALLKYTYRMWLSQLPTLTNLALWNKTDNPRTVRCKCGQIGNATQ